MDEKRFKIYFFANFRKFQKKLPICKKRYAEILNVARAVVVIVEKNEKRIDRIFFGSHFEEQSVEEGLVIKQDSLLGYSSEWKSNKSSFLFRLKRKLRRNFHLAARMKFPNTF